MSDQQRSNHMNLTGASATCAGNASATSAVSPLEAFTEGPELAFHRKLRLFPACSASEKTLRVGEPLRSPP